MENYDENNGPLTSLPVNQLERRPTEMVTAHAKSLPLEKVMVMKKAMWPI